MRPFNLLIVYNIVSSCINSVLLGSYVAYFLADKLENRIAPAVADERWTFAESIEAADTNVLKPFIVGHTDLTIEHGILHADLIDNAHRYTKTERLERLKVALMQAELLEFIHRHYLQSAEKIISDLRNQQRTYIRHLADLGVAMPDVNDDLDGINDTENGREWLRNVTKKDWDLGRLLLLRGRRTLMLSVAVVNNFELYGQWVLLLDSFLSYVAMYQALILLPRFLTNLWHVSSHLIAPDDKEKDLDTSDIWVAHMDMTERWWELAYDLGWITGGILNAFILTASLAPLAVYTGIALPSYNFTLHLTRLMLLNSRYQELSRPYRDEISEYDENNQRHKEIKAYLAQLDRKWECEQAALILRVCISACIVICMITSLSFIAINPLIPFLGALFSVLITIAGKLIGDYFIPKHDASLGSLERSLDTPVADHVVPEVIDGEAADNLEHNGTESGYDEYQETEQVNTQPLPPLNTGINPAPIKRVQSLSALNKHTLFKDSGNNPMQQSSTTVACNLSDRGTPTSNGRFHRAQSMPSLTQSELVSREQTDPNHSFISGRNGRF